MSPAVRARLEELNARFAWAIDLHDWDVLAEILAPDVHYVSVGREFHDLDAVLGSFRARTGERVTRHGLGTLLLSERPDGTVTGRSSWHTFAAHGPRTPGEPAEIGLYMVADFHDVYVRGADDSWRISERIIVPIFRDPALGPDAAGPCSGEDIAAAIDS